MTVYVDGENIKIEQVEEVTRGGAKVEFSERGKNNIENCWASVLDLVNTGEAIYGVTTGIGEFARIRISPEQSSQLQRNIIYSHAAGTGDLQPDEVVRGAMLLRANVLAKGYSGVRLSTAQMLLDMLNKGVHPVVFEKGSVGTSGDLSPLSQLAEVCLGEGEAFYQGERLPGAEVMKRAGLKPLEPTYKEGLGLINGSQMVTSGASLLLVDARSLLKNAFIASAMTIDALKGVPKAYDARLHAARPFKGQHVVAHNLRLLMADSEVIAEKSGTV
ncbi:MAG: aromatic amino acid lyase, partial [Candidatus Zixiibacteriota bacterium]